MENENIEKENNNNRYEILLRSVSNNSLQSTRKILIPELETLNDTSNINTDLNESSNSQTILKNTNNNEKKIKNLTEENILLKSQINNFLMQISILEQKLSKKSNLDSKVLVKKIERMEDELENKSIIISALKKENKYLKEKLASKEKILFNYYKKYNRISLNKNNTNNFLLEKKPQEEELKNEKYNFLMNSNNNCINTANETNTYDYLKFRSNNNNYGSMSEINSYIISLKNLNDYINNNYSQRKNKKKTSPYNEISYNARKNMKSANYLHNKKNYTSSTIDNSIRHNFNDNIQFTQTFYNRYLFGNRKTLSVKDINNQKTIVNRDGIDGYVSNKRM